MELQKRGKRHSIIDRSMLVVFIYDGSKGTDQETRILRSVAALSFVSMQACCNKHMNLRAEYHIMDGHYEEKMSFS